VAVRLLKDDGGPISPQYFNDPNAIGATRLRRLC
jgi:hypothetical protein